MNFMKFGGLAICLTGIILHVYFKTVKSKLSFSMQIDEKECVRVD
jgi:hypothetical protein